jgi:hypothetical protein
MVLYFGPNTERVKQCLNIFFEKYSIISEENSNHLQLASRLVLYGIRQNLDGNKVEIMKNVQ